MKFKAILKTAILVLLVGGILFLLQCVLMDKYVSGIVEGSLIEEYYAETTDHDVIFVGDCEVYENFSPITLWNEYGITSYIRGSAQQLIWQSYYLLEETLQYEIPKVVVFNVLAMKYNEPQKEAYNRMSLDGMRLSESKLASIQASMLPTEKLLDYLFPILRFHDRWGKLTANDFKYMFNKPKLFHNGYYMRADVKPPAEFVVKPLADYRFGDNAYHYLDLMVELCAAHDIELILIKAPTIYPAWYDQWDRQMTDYAAEHGLTYINFLERQDETGIDYNTDTYDGGGHMNLSGAEKLSTYFGEILRDSFAVPDHRDDQALSLVYQQKTQFYNDMRDQQYAEIEKYGHLTGIGVKE